MCNGYVQTLFDRRSEFIAFHGPEPKYSGLLTED